MEKLQRFDRRPPSILRVLESVHVIKFDQIDLNVCRFQLLVKLLRLRNGNVLILRSVDNQKGSIRFGNVKDRGRVAPGFRIFGKIAS